MSSNTWSVYQQAIFQNVADGKGHTVVLARAGSGKTTTIMEALKYVPDTKCTPCKGSGKFQGAPCFKCRGAGECKDVLMVAFNKIIAEELKSRTQGPEYVGVDVSTLHSYGLRQITRHLGKGSFKVEPNRLKPWVAELIPGEGSSVYEVRKELIRAVSLAKAGLIGFEYFKELRDVEKSDMDGDDAGDLLQDHVTRALLRIEELMTVFDMDAHLDDDMRKKFPMMVWELLLKSRSDTSIIDFDDMVWLPVIYGWETWGSTFVFVDETQDLNAAQVELAIMACLKDPRRGRIICVGDDRQAIYGFRGADSNAIPSLIERLSAKVMKLTVCYRCGTSIVNEARTLVPDFEPAPGMHAGRVETDVKLDKMISEAAPGDFIISRANAPLVSLCWQFIRDNKRASIQGRDIGGHLAAFVNKARKSKTDKGKLVSSVADLLSYTDSWLEKECARLRKKDISTEAVQDRAECVRFLCEDQASIDAVLAKIEALFGDVGEAQDRIVLTSTHRSKGLERERCWILFDTYKHLRAKGGMEEKNLYYVAVTRAKRELYLVRTPKKKEAP